MNSLSLCYKYYFERSLFELAEYSAISCSSDKATLYADGKHDFLSHSYILKNIHAISFFLHVARLQNLLLARCFPLTYDLNISKLALIGTYHFWTLFYTLFVYFSYLSLYCTCNSISCSSCSAL